MTATAIVKLRHYWSQSGATIGNPLSLDELSIFEAKRAVRLPLEIRELYLGANGLAPPNDQDVNGFSFWPLQKNQEVQAFEDGKWSTPETRNCFLFADYLSLSWAYAFQPSPDLTKARICIVGTSNGEPIWIAESLNEFIDLYIHNDSRLYPNENTGGPG
jgi:hypothetical protein